MNVTEIKQAILDLPRDDYAELMHWIREQDWEQWEREFDEDVQSGRLDALAAEALEAKARGDLRDL